MLRRTKVLTEVDYIALGNLCFDIHLLESASEKLAVTPLLIRTARSGVIHQNPLLQIVGTLTDRVQRGLREFGMTPAGRSSIRIDSDGGGEEADPWADL